MKKLIFIFLMMSIFPLLTYSQWNIETVDTAETVGKACDIIVDANGYPHISYRDGTIGWRLKYAHWNNSEWQKAFVETNESVYGVTSIALDDTGNPHIAFFTDGKLWHAWWDGSDWQQEVVDALIWVDVGEWNSITFDTDGYPHIAYTYYTGDSYLKHAYKDVSGWHTQVADSLTGDEFQYVSLALDGNNNPHISYYDWKDDDLKYAYYNGANWNIERVDSTGQVGTCSSIALDGIDYPHISYTDGTNGGVKYASWDGSDWQIETVESNIVTGLGLYTSLALDANDRPYISYAEYMSNMRFAYWDGSNWQIEIVDSAVSCEWTSLAIDNNGYCHIAYYDSGDSTNLKYAKRIPTTEGIAFYYMNENNINIYPNPSKESITIDISSNNSLKFKAEIFDIQGKKLKQQRLTKVKSEMNISDLSRGIYIIKIKNENKKVIKCNKIVKE